MTQLFGFAALAIGGYWIARRVQKKMHEIDRRLSEKARDNPDTAPVNLVRDAETGRYKPTGR
ncbi:hypothetical protein GCM10011316_24870 [Roseibium aquae]|uniref:Uncharacterized protein n=1 Tax=Roseibium aquae TaxID=1323746 RepID=A0A916X2D1_9HYPH|nr:hypothetical protein [Roseibium aquae]GGB51901.1 hypothetical protein GCM10011316_24870 [Roseibium aquae]